MSQGSILKKKAFAAFILDDLKLDFEDGSLFLIAEQRPDLDRYEPHVEYNDILIIKISPKRTLDWLIRLPKRQKRLFEDENLFSYSVFVRNDNLYFLYNDLRGNIERRKGNKKLTAYQAVDSEGVFVGVRSDGSREEKRVSSLIKTEKKMSVYPMLGWELNKGIILYGEQVKNDKVMGYFVTLDWSFFSELFE